MLSFALLCPIRLVAHSDAQSPAATFDLDKDRQILVSLDGPWQRHVGDNPHLADTDFERGQRESGAADLRAREYAALVEVSPAGREPDTNGIRG